MSREPERHTCNGKDGYFVRLHEYHALAARLRKLEEELKERDASFDLRWKADMRAIKRWQAATGKTLTWPDHADLCVWLMEQLENKK